MTIAIDLFDNETVTYSTSKWDKFEQEIDKPYCKIYQLKLTEVLTYNRYRREQQARINREKINANHSVDYRLSEQRLHKEYMNHIRERTKAHTHDVLESYRKKSNHYSIKPKLPVTLSIAPSAISSLFEPRRRCNLKVKLTPILTKPERIKSPSLSSEKNSQKSKLTPIVKEMEIDENLLSTSKFSFTEATSSSRNRHYKSHFTARQNILNAIMIHLKSYEACDISKGPSYEDIKYRFSSSISPRVYESFERIIS